MSEQIEIYQGDHVSPAFIRPGILGDGVAIDSNWTCKTAIIDTEGTVVVVARTVTEKSGDSLHFFVALTPEDTEQLTADRRTTEYTWVIELSNAVIVPAYKREYHITLFVKKQGIT